MAPDTPPSATPPDPTVRTQLLHELRSGLSLSDLHGFQYVLEVSRSCFCSVVWSVVIVLSLVLVGGMLAGLLNEYNYDNVRITVEPDYGNHSSLYFPSLTLCNSIRIRESFLTEFNITADELTAIERFYFEGSPTPMTSAELSHVRRVSDLDPLHVKAFYAIVHRTLATSHSQTMELLGNGLDVSKIPKEVKMWSLERLAGQDLESKVVLWASYRRQQHDPRNQTRFFPFYPTDFGRCVVVHPMLYFNPSLKHLPFEDVRVHYNSTSPGVGYGQDNGLELLVDAETFDNGYIPSNRDSGFRLSITPFRDIPLLSHSAITAQPGMVTLVDLRPSVASSTENVLRLPPDERRCYTDGEFEITNFKDKEYRYSLHNCYTEAVETAAYERCGCDFYQRVERLDHSQPCFGENLTCFHDVLQEWGQIETTVDSSGHKKQCLPACDTQDHQLTVSHAPYNHLHKRDLCELYNKLSVICRNEFKRPLLDQRYEGLCSGMKKNRDNFKGCMYMDKDGVPQYNDTNIQRHDPTFHTALNLYARDNLSKVQIFVTSPRIPHTIRDVKMTLYVLIANIGGILGLAMGASVVTVAETLYHVYNMVVIVFVGKVLPWMRGNDGKARESAM